MKRKRTGLLKKVQWRAECIAFLVLERVLHLVPLASLWRAGTALSGLARFLPSRRRIVRSNLRTVLGPGASKEEIESLTRNVFRHTAANLLTSLKGAHMPLEEIRSALQIEQQEVAERALSRKKGILILIPHMGNWEFLAQAMAAFRPDIKIAAVYRPLNNIYLDKVLRERREKNGMKLFAKLRSYHAPIRFLKDKQSLGLLVDQRAGQVGTRTPFFGRLMSMTPLPAFIQRRTGCPVIGISMRTSAPGRWTLKFHEPSQREDETFTVAHMAALIEEVIGESVVDEFWMQDLWRINKYRPLELSGKTGPVRLARDRDKPLHPFSVLVRAPDQPERFAETIPALSALAASRPDMDLHLFAREIIRQPAAEAGVRHAFHPLEDDRLPEFLEFAIVLTGRELAARELARLYSGPIYCPPVTAQSRHTWFPMAVDESLPADQRWLQTLRSLGMHDPPVEWEYV